MGTTHAEGGAAAWLVLVALTRQPPLVAVEGAGLAVAGALAVDIDHRSSDAARFARLAGLVLAGVAGWAVLAHRLPVGVLAVPALIGALPWLTRPHTGRFRGVVHSVWGLAFCVAAALGPAWAGLWPWWAGLAVVTGWVSHLVLDAMTKEGLPLAWPSRDRWGWLPKAYSMTTGGKRVPGRRKRGWRTGPEFWLVQPALAVLAVGSAVLIVMGR
jgi:membrane-bound metal-dependent hydrolase YbcI (DUF457 family)